MKLLRFRLGKRAQVQRVIAWILGLSILVVAIIAVVNIVLKAGG